MEGGSWGAHEMLVHSQDQSQEAAKISRRRPHEYYRIF